MFAVGFICLKFKTIDMLRLSLLCVKYKGRFSDTEPFIKNVIDIVFSCI